MLSIHYLEDSRAHRILWLMEELGLEYEVKLYRRGPDMRAPAELRKIHPLGKSPVLQDGPLTLAESGAIVEYLLTTYGGDSGLGPEAPGTDRWRYAFWLHYAEGSAMPLLLQKLLFVQIPRHVPGLIRPVAQKICTAVLARQVDPQLADHFAFWEDTLAGDDHFAGTVLSAADIMMSFPVEAALDRAITRPAPPAISAWVKMIRARPAYQKALERGAYRYSNT